MIYIADNSVRLNSTIVAVVDRLDMINCIRYTIISRATIVQSSAPLQV